MPFSPGYPLRSTGRYDEHLPSDAEEAGTLVRLPGFAESSGSVEDMLAFTRTICTARAQGGTQIYLALGPYSENYIRLYGTIPPERYEAYVDLLVADPGFSPEFVDEESMTLRCG